MGLFDYADRVAPARNNDNCVYVQARRVTTAL